MGRGSCGAREDPAGSGTGGGESRGTGPKYARAFPERRQAPGHGPTSRRAGLPRPGLCRRDPGSPVPPAPGPAPQAPRPQPAVLTGSRRPRRLPRPRGGASALGAQARHLAAGADPPPRPPAAARRHPPRPRAAPAGPQLPPRARACPPAHPALRRGRPAAESGPDPASRSMRSQRARRRRRESPGLRVFGEVGGTWRTSQWGQGAGRGGGARGAEGRRLGRGCSGPEVRAADVTFGLGRDGASPAVAPACPCGMLHRKGRLLDLAGRLRNHCKSKSLHLAEDFRSVALSPQTFVPPPHPHCMSTMTKH